LPILANKLLEQLLSIYQRMRRFFRQENIAQREFDSLLRGQFTAASLHHLARRCAWREAGLRQIAAINWQNPVHVTGSLPNCRDYASYAEAVAAYPHVRADYQQILSDNIAGPLVMQAEIGFRVLDSGGKIFNIHFHAIVEAKEYEKFKENTRQWRQGRQPNNWALLSRKVARRRGGQPNGEYVANLANYFNKFTVREADNRTRHKGFLPWPELTVEIDRELFIRGGKPRRINKFWRNILAQLKRWEIFELTQTKQYYPTSYNIEPNQTSLVLLFYQLFGRPQIWDSG